MPPSPPPAKLSVSFAHGQQFHATLSQGQPGPPGPAGPPGVTVSSQNDLTATYAADTVYQNPYPHAIYVLTSWQLNGKASMVAMCDANNPPSTPIAEIAEPVGGTGMTAPLTLLVLPGYYYVFAVMSGTPALVHWIEYH